MDRWQLAYMTDLITFTSTNWLVINGCYMVYTCLYGLLYMVMQVIYRIYTLTLVDENHSNASCFSLSSRPMSPFSREPPPRLHLRFLPDIASGRYVVPKPRSAENHGPWSANFLEMMGIGTYGNIPQKQWGTHMNIWVWEGPTLEGFLGWEKSSLDIGGSIAMFDYPMVFLNVLMMVDQEIFTQSTLPNKWGLEAEFPPWTISTAYVQGNVGECFFLTLRCPHHNWLVVWNIWIIFPLILGC